MTVTNGHTVVNTSGNTSNSSGRQTAVSNITSATSSGTSGAATRQSVGAQTANQNRASQTVSARAGRLRAGGRAGTNCFTGDSKVRTPNGDVQMSDLRVGDLVSGLADLSLSFQTYIF